MADENKKDLTGILEFSEKMKDAGQLPAAPEGSLMAEAPIEKIDDFESLDDFAKHNPAAEAPPDDFAMTPEPPAQQTSGTNEFPTTTGADQAASGGFDMGQEAISEAPPAPAEEPAPMPDLGVAPPDSAMAFDAPPAPVEEAPAVAMPEPEPEPEPEVAVAPPGEDDTPPAPMPEPEPSFSPAPVPPPKPQPPEEAMKRVKAYSERVSVGKPAVAAAFPFSLLIEGQLAPEEKERLLDILNRESMGIRDLDLEPQLEGGRVLIPRISEYAGVLLVQALRSARCKIRLGPSDEIFSTDDTRSSNDEPVAETAADVAHTSSAEPDHPAEHMPLTTDTTIPGSKSLAVIDVVTASATLGTEFVEAESSVEYNELVEALQRELRYKAHRKGANAVVNYSIRLTALSLPTHYRLMAVGSAVKAVF